MKFRTKKKTHHIIKPRDEVATRRVWIRLYTVFTVLHFVVLVGMSYVFRELVRGIDAPVEGVPQTQLPRLEVIHSSLTTIEAQMSTKERSLLDEGEQEAVVVPEMIEEEGEGEEVGL